jgi:hypothetical protein
MVLLIALLLSLLGLLGGREPTPEITPSPATGSIRVVARACPAGVHATQTSADVCSIWPDGAAIQATDRKGNAWGMNASRDPSLPGNPVVYSLDSLAFGTYALGKPVPPAGYNGFFIAGATLTASGNAEVDLSPAHSHVELTVYFLKNA